MIHIGGTMLRLEQPSKNVIKIELHHGSRKSVATLRTVRTLIVRRTHRTSLDIGWMQGLD